MSKTFLGAVKKRRSYYSFKNYSPVTDDKIEEIINTVVKYGPSAFNSQSARIVLLLGESHKRFWNIVEDVLRKKIGEERFVAMGKKIDNLFASGYGTVLFYEDWDVVEGLQKQYPEYAANMPIHSYTSGGMHQFAIWTALEEVGFGASLQHYNPIIDEAVAKEFGIPSSWHLNAQMPFGVPVNEPGAKSFKPLEERVKVFK